MPRATVSVETEKHNLETLAGAFVILKRLSFGQKMERQAMLSKMKLRTGDEQPNNRAGRRSRKASNTLEGEVEMLQAQATLYSFTHCIVDHNLYADDAETIKLNLSKQSDVEKLDPKVGEEIDQLIDDMNNFEGDEEDDEGNSLGNSQDVSEPQS